MNYSREYLLRYLSGQMPASEMHALEKEALEDPFLADALEGLQQENEAETRKELVTLDQRLADRTKHKVIPMPATKWWRVAAAAALTGVMGIAAYYISQQNEPEQVIAQKTEIVSSDTTIAQEDKISMPDSEKITSNQIAKLPVPNAAQTRAPVSTIGQKDMGPELKEKEAAETAISARETGGKKETDKLPPVAIHDEAIATQGTQPEKARQAMPQRSGITENRSLVYYYNGQVTDLQHQPVPFANISIRESRSSTYADVKGYFRLVSGDSSLLVDIKSVGFQSRTIQLSMDQPQQMVILQREPESKKTVMSRAKKEMVQPADSNQPKALTEDHDQAEAEPRDGFGNYQFYLLNNIRIPAEAKNDRINGIVEISFQVEITGKLSDFKVERGLCPSCDREAIRLVKEGPPWILYNSELPVRTRVSVVF